MKLPVASVCYLRVRIFWDTRAVIYSGPGRECEWKIPTSTPYLYLQLHVGPCPDALHSPDHGQLAVAQGDKSPLQGNQRGVECLVPQLQGLQRAFPAGF